MYVFYVNSHLTIFLFCILFFFNSDIYKAIYDIHENGCEYNYSVEAKSFYVEYSNELSDNMNAQWEKESICSDNFSKDKRNFIR